MLLLAEEFIEHLLYFREVWLSGYKGSGKTLLSVAIADYLFRRGFVDGVVANFPTVFPTSVKGGDDGTLLNRAILFDEAWWWLDSRTSLINPREYGAFSRKFKCIWIFPSVYPVDKRLRSIECWRHTRIDLLNVWVYKWQQVTERGTREGWFLLQNPSKYFGYYDTDYVPVDDGLLSNRYGRTMYKLTEYVDVQGKVEITEYLDALSLLAGV